MKRKQYLRIAIGLYLRLLIILIYCTSINEVSGKPQTKLKVDDITDHLFRGSKARLIWSAKDDKKSFPVDSSIQRPLSEQEKTTKHVFNAKYSPISYEVQCGVSKSPKPTSRIVGRTNATRGLLLEHILDRINKHINCAGEFPWQISLQLEMVHDNITRMEHICGGAVISSEWVISAAHCLESLKLPYTYAVAGEHDLLNVDGTEQKNRIQEIYIDSFHHGKYSAYNDFLLIKVDPINMDGQYVAPICLPNTNLSFASGTAKVSGWGSSEIGGPESTILSKVTMPIVDHEKCKKFYPTITECHLCAGEEGKGPCEGDSGGPLVCLLDDEYWYLCGIVNYSIGCGEKEYPGVFELVPCHTEYVINKTGLK